MAPFGIVDFEGSKSGKKFLKNTLDKDFGIT
jgi:hypothetical protein